MRRFMAPIVLLLLAGLAHGDPMSEARAVGQGSVNTIYGGINYSGSAWTQEAGQALPGGYAPYGVDPATAGAQGSALRAECAANPNSRVECAGLNASADTSNSGVYTTADMIVPEDASKLANGQLPLSSALTGLGIGGSYSACSTKTVTKGQQYYDEQYCHNYYLRVLDQPCAKTLDVEVTWHYACPSDAVGPIQTDPSWSGGYPVPHHCNRWVENIQYRCAAGSLGWSLQYGNYCFDPETGEYLGQAQEDDQSYTETFPADSWATERDIWDNPCAGYEARVPPGLLPPDGVNEAVGPATGPGPMDKCERATSYCTQGKETRVIDNHPVTRKCWQYTNSFNCVNLDPKSDCGQPRWGSCTKIDTSCVDWDQFIPNFCTAEQTRFSCMVEDTTRQETVTDCGSQVYQESSGVVWDTAHEADNDLAAVVAFMEAGREAGGYIDPNSLEIFKGFDSRCRKKLFGLVNCCNKGGTSSGSLFSNSAIAAVSAGGQALVSTYTFDALFASDAPNWVINGFSSVFGSGTSSALAGMLAGQVTVESFLTSLIPGPWSIAMMALQFSGLLDCEDRDIETALRRDARLCVDLGGYCSKKLPIIGTCLERTYSYCCFNSRLAKAINTQGKAQLGLGMGTAKRPNCGGFTASQLQQIDLAAMDLSEFLDQVAPNEVTPTATSCYFQGETACPAVH